MPVTIAELRSSIAAATILLFSVACAPNGLVAQSSSGCLPADTIFVPWRLDYFKKLVSSEEPTDSTPRGTGNVPCQRIKGEPRDSSPNLRKCGLRHKRQA